MHRVQLRNLDLNLLLPLHALLQERSVTLAAKRLPLSQSAMSRALERLREVVGDDLLVRTEGRYELTARGAQMLEELDLLLPRLARFWNGDAFEPASTQGRVRVGMTDYAAAVLLPELVAACAREAPGLRVEVTPWQEHSYEELDASALDLLLSPLAVPATFCVEPLFEEHFVCLAAERHPHTEGGLSLERYCEYGHVSVETEPRQQNLIDRSLAEIGRRRRVVLHLPYLLPAVRVVEATELLLTTPLRLAEAVAGRFRLRQIAVPAEIGDFQYAMVWHRRLDQEPLHAWFRAMVREVRQAGARVSADRDAGSAGRGGRGVSG